LSVHEVANLLVANDFSNYKEIFLREQVNGQCLMECKVDDLTKIGIQWKPKATVLLKLIEKWKETGVRKEDLSDNEGTYQDNR